MNIPRRIPERPLAATAVALTMVVGVTTGAELAPHPNAHPPHTDPTAAPSPRIDGATPDPVDQTPAVPAPGPARPVASPRNQQHHSQPTTKPVANKPRTRSIGSNGWPAPAVTGRHRRDDDEPLDGSQVAAARAGQDMAYRVYENWWISSGYYDQDHD
jgi:hypothetical protein